MGLSSRYFRLIDLIEASGFGITINNATSNTGNLLIRNQSTANILNIQDTGAGLTIEKTSGTSNLVIQNTVNGSNFSILHTGTSGTLALEKSGGGVLNVRNTGTGDAVFGSVVGSEIYTITGSSVNDRVQIDSNNGTNSSYIRVLPTGLLLSNQIQIGDVHAGATPTGGMVKYISNELYYYNGTIWIGIGVSNNINNNISLYQATTINSATSTTYIPIVWDTKRNVSAGAGFTWTSPSSEITMNAVGYYEITYNLIFSVTSGSGDKNVISRLSYDTGSGFTADTTTSQMILLVGNGDETNITRTVIYNCTVANSKARVEFNLNSGSGTVSTIQYYSELTIIKLI